MDPAGSLSEHELPTQPFLIGFGNNAENQPYKPADTRRRFRDNTCPGADNRRDWLHKELCPVTSL